MLSLAGLTRDALAAVRNRPIFTPLVKRLMERLVEVRSTGGLARDWPVLNCRKRGGLELSEAQCLRACGCNEGSKCYHCGFMNRAESRRLF